MPGRLLAQLLRDPHRADICFADSLLNGAITWTPSPLDEAMCFLPLGHFALAIVLRHYAPNDQPLLAALYAHTDNVTFCRGGPHDLDFEPLNPISDHLADLHDVAFDYKRVLRSLVDALEDLQGSCLEDLQGSCLQLRSGNGTVGEYAVRQVDQFEELFNPLAGGGATPTAAHM
jgi:hypothetical protein